MEIMLTKIILMEIMLTKIMLLRTMFLKTMLRLFPFRIYGQDMRKTRWY